eukprot:TRINITY_DN571_c0_g1_i1.p1 TRINITY_DN571_c0_g1~~TRINITY_DN571_c0_g1_i1.p1  ORF type:complete len:314 (-),score=98.61 TRINITY_DN571_c0_g1_i1:55-996(-)
MSKLDTNKITITIVEARNLPAADANGFSDPYVIIKDVQGLHMKGSKTKTSIKKKTLNPVWNEAYEFTYNYKLTKLSFKVMDHDVIGSDDFLGSVKIPIETLYNNVIDHWFPLTKKGKTSGDLHLKIHAITNFPVVQPEQSLSIMEQSVKLGVGWEVSKKKTIDLDASVLVLNAEKRTIDTVSFRALTSSDGAIKHSGDNRTGEGSGDDETITFDFAKVRPEARYMIFLVNSFTGVEFSEIKSAYVRILSSSTGTTLAFSRLSKMAPRTGLMFGCLKKDTATGYWIFYCFQRLIYGKNFQESTTPAIDSLPAGF